MLHDWLFNKPALDKKINTNLLLVTGRLMADKLGLQSEKIDESWLQRWLGCHGIRSLLFYEEGADCADYKDWLRQNESLLVTLEFI